MKTLLLSLSAIILFVLSILLRPTATDTQEYFSRMELACNWLMVAAFLSLCTALIVTGRAERRANPSPFDKEFSHLIK